MKMGEPIMAMEFLMEGKLSLVRGGHEIGTLAPPQSLGFLGILARGESEVCAQWATARTDFICGQISPNFLRGG